MRSFDKFVQALWSAQRGLHRKRLRRIVSPRVIHRKFRNWHDLNGIDPQIAQVGQLRYNFVECTWTEARLIVEGAHMHFVDNKFIPRRHCEIVACPVKVGIVNDCVAR